MFKQNKLTIFQWFVLILIMSVPILNIIFLVWGFLTNRFSRNLKNFIIAYLIFYLLFAGGLFQFGFF